MRKFCVFIFFVIICFMVTDNAYADYETDATDFRYYKITQYDEEWSDFQTTEEMYEACQLQAEILNNMTTEELVNAVLEYPLMVNIYAYGDKGQAIDVLRRHFNGIDELCKRNDIWDGLCIYLEKIANKNEARKIGEDYGLKCDYCMTLIDYIYNSTNYIGDDVSKRLMNAYNDIKALCDDGVMTEGTISIDYLRDLSTRNLLNNYKNIEISRIENSAYSSMSTNIVKIGSGIIYTPKGTQITLNKYEFVNPSVALQIDKEIDAAYPNAVRISGASAHYNCHSYAWYNTSPSNVYWMEPIDAIKYVMDGSYKTEMNVLAISVGTKVQYVDKSSAQPFVHSAIVYSVSSNSFSFLSRGIGVTVKSKWGSAGVYQHGAAYSPYDIDALYFFN